MSEDEVADCSRIAFERFLLTLSGRFLIGELSSVGT